MCRKDSAAFGDHARSWARRRTPFGDLARSLGRAHLQEHGMRRWALLLLLLPFTSAFDVSGWSIRYFAYGSNLATSVREGRRGLRPLSSAPGFVRDHRLAFNLPGMGPAEPAFASIQPEPGEECHGGLFELSLMDWSRLCASEGVPFAYRVASVDVQCYDGASVPAYTLIGNARAPFGDLQPSARYLELIRDGARELGLTDAWQDRLASLRAAPLGTQARAAVAPPPPQQQQEEQPRAFERRRGATFT